MGLRWGVFGGVFGGGLRGGLPGEVFGGVSRGRSSGGSPGGGLRKSPGVSGGPKGGAAKGGAAKGGAVPGQKKTQRDKKKGNGTKKRHLGQKNDKRDEPKVVVERRGEGAG